MLKIWKQAWKREDSKRSQTGQDGDKGGQSSGTGSVAPHLDALAAAPPSDTALLISALGPTELPVLKRTNTSIGTDTFISDELDRSRKRLKVEHAVADHDHLGSRLPELPDISPQSGPIPIGEVLDQARAENTIAFLPVDQVYQLLAQYLLWAVQVEASHSTHRSVLIVAGDQLTVDKSLSEIEARTTLRAEKYANFDGISNIPQWAVQLQKDVVIVTVVPFRRALKEGKVHIAQFHTFVILDTLVSQDVKFHNSLQIIMEDFYRRTERLSRPRVLVLVSHRPGIRSTLSTTRLLSLEALFDAKYFSLAGDSQQEASTISDMPTNLVVLYECPGRIAETKLFKQLHQLDPAESSLRSHLRAARCTLAEIGTCASDLVWRRALKEIEARVTHSYDEDDEPDGQQAEKPDSASSAILKTVKDWNYSMPNPDSSARGYNITPKFSRLVHILKSCQPYGESFRAIIFVQKRVVALAITDLLRNLGDHIDHIRPYALTGVRSHMDMAQQEEICRAFSAGTYNVLIATKSVEDLDIPKAVIIIRFDLFESQISYAFAQLRARDRRSHVVHMLERGNDAHRRIFSQITRMDNTMKRWTKAHCKSQGSSTPPSTLQETSNPYHSDSEDEDEEFIQDPTTSGRIYVQDATYIIYRFAAGLQKQWEAILDQLLFTFEEVQLENRTSHIVCGINLPTSPIHGISGSHVSSRALARRAACYQACLELHNKGLLDYRLFPLPPEVWVLGKRQRIRDTHSLEQESKALLVSRRYLIKLPDFWKNMLSAPVMSLYPTVIVINHNEGAYAPILILTRRPLPQFNPFKLFFSGVPAEVRLKPCAELRMNEKQFYNVQRYTTRVCRAVANKPFICHRESMAYFFAPLVDSWKDTAQNHPDISDSIPWESVSLAAKSWMTTLPADDIEELARDVEGAVIQDRMVEFTRRYYALRLRTDLTPLSKPVDSPREAGYDNLVEYCKARRKGFEGLQNYSQPLIEVAKVPAVINHLNPTSRPADLQRVPAKYLIPELCAKFTIPATTFRTALLLPSITRRIDDLLLVKELNARLFDHSISEQLLHVAISAPSGCVEYDYERLELLGDSFLKYLSSIYVFVTNPAQNEGALHIARQHIVSNRVLLDSAIRTCLPSYIQAKPFAVRMWQPPSFALSVTSFHGSDLSGNASTQQNTKDLLLDEEVDSKLEAVAVQMKSTSQLPAGSVDTEYISAGIRQRKWQDDQNTHWLGNKAIADVAEAIIGAAYLSGGRENALKVTKALNIPIPNIHHWSDFSRKALAPPPGISAKPKTGSLEAMEALIGHKICRPHLLAQALTHNSRQDFESTSYERLEFIGDAILDFMVIRYIFDRHGQLSPGGLTLLKAAMVSNSTLAALCISSGLNEYLLFQSFQLEKSIESYVDHLKAKQTEEYMQAERDNRSPGQYWLDLEPPKALSDVIESIIGAIYISDNFNPIGTEAFFDNVLKPFYDRHITLKTLSHHPTKILFELFQAQGCQQFQVIKERDQDLVVCYVIVHDVILARAEDITASFASRLASSFALDALEGDPEFLTITCDCRAHRQSKKGMKKVFLEDFEDEEVRRNVIQEDRSTS